jgi:F-type H+-transporting ATPase subunit delta
MMTETAKKYGGSLYELALEESMDTQVLEQLQEVLALLTEDTLYIRLLSEPSIPKGERIALLDEAFEKEK